MQPCDAVACTKPARYRFEQPVGDAEPLRVMYACSDHKYRIIGILSQIARGLGIPVQVHQHLLDEDDSDA